MKRVTGLGGVSFKSENPEKLYEWYERHLGLRREGGGVVSNWRDAEHKEKRGMTVWGIFPRESTYFDPRKAGFMLNYRVDDLDAVLEALGAEGVPIDPHREDYDYGRFTWISDPEGNRIELWQPSQSVGAGEG
jgi:predicted enzyme related to lactoylglutathione lyase